MSNIRARTEPQEKHRHLQSPLPDKIYFDFAKRHHLFLSRCVIVSRFVDLESDPVAIRGGPGPESDGLALRKFIMQLGEEPRETPARSRQNTANPPAYLPRLLPKWDPAFKIVQFWDTEDVPADVWDLITQWKTCIGRENHLLFSEGSAREFIRRNYSPRFVEAYDFCFHPAMKCDYFRLAYLYLNGGVYLDADEKPLTAIPNMDFVDGEFIILSPMIREIDERYELTAVSIQHLLNRPKSLDGPDCYFNNNRIAATRKHDIVRIALIRATNLLLDAKESGGYCDVHSTTGPTNLTCSICAHLLSTACAGESPARLFVIDWTRYCSTRRLNYKSDSRHWGTTMRRSAE